MIAGGVTVALGPAIIYFLRFLWYRLVVSSKAAEDDIDVEGIGRDLAEGLVRPYPARPLQPDRKSDYGQVLRSLLAVTVDHLGFKWWQKVMIVDWGQADAQQLPSLQKAASVVFVLLAVFWHVNCRGWSRVSLLSTGFLQLTEVAVHREPLGLHDHTSGRVASGHI